MKLTGGGRVDAVAEDGGLPKAGAVGDHRLRDSKNREKGGEKWNGLGYASE